MSLAKREEGLLPGTGTYPARALHRLMPGPDQIGMSEKGGLVDQICGVRGTRDRGVENAGWEDGRRPSP